MLFTESDFERKSEEWKSKIANSQPWILDSLFSINFEHSCLYSLQYSSCVDVTQPHTVRVCVRPCPLWWARVISLPSRQTSLTLARQRLYSITVYIAQLGGLRKSCKQLLTRQKVVLFHLTYIMFFSLMKDYLHVWQFFGDHLLFCLFCTSSGINVYYYYIIITILLLLYYYYYIIITLLLLLFRAGHTQQMLRQSNTAVLRPYYCFRIFACHRSIICFGVFWNVKKLPQPQLCYIFTSE